MDVYIYSEKKEEEEEEKENVAHIFSFLYTHRYPPSLPASNIDFSACWCRISTEREREKKWYMDYIREGKCSFFFSVQ